MIDKINATRISTLQPTPHRKGIGNVWAVKPSELHFLSALAQYEGLEQSLISRYGKPFMTKYGADWLREFLLCLYSAPFLALQDVFHDLRNVRVLDLGCGSNGGTTDYTVGFGILFNTDPVRGTNPFEPWLCRILHLIGTKPVGVDAGFLEGEDFEHYNIDLTKDNCLEIFPDSSFDAVIVTRLFNSPSRTEDNRFKPNLERQTVRILKPNGQYITDSSKSFNKRESVFDDVRGMEE